MTAPAAEPKALVNHGTGATKAPKPVDVLREKLARLTPQMTAITGDTTYAARALQLLILCANGNPDLYLCTEASLAASMLKVAQWGLDIGETAHIVPFNVKVSKKGQPDAWEKRAQAVADYRGLMQLATDRFTGAVREFLPPRVVYANDAFDCEYGTNEHLRHVPENTAKRGPAIGAYVVAVLSMNVRTFVYMTLEEIEVVRAKSKQWGPDKVKECPEWYMLKTVIRRFCNKLPKKGRKLTAALSEDDDNVPDGNMEEIAPAVSLGAGNVRQLESGAEREPGEDDE